MGAERSRPSRAQAPPSPSTEYEYEIPRKDAEEFLATACAGQLMEKKRHRIEWDGLDWVIGALRELLLAEITPIRISTFPP